MIRSWRQRLGFGAALAAVFVAALDLTVISTILPGIIFELEIPFTELDRAAWIVTAYLLAYTVSIPLLGRLSDRTGRWSIFLVALLLFAVGSVWCGLAEGLASLIAGRVVQALGGGAMVPVAMALGADLMPPGKRGLAMGAVAAVDTAGWVAGPLYGAGIIAVFGGWRWVFWVNLPLAGLAAALVVLAWRASGWRLAVPTAANVPRAVAMLRSVDWAGVILLSGGLTAVNLGLSLGAESLSATSTLTASLADEQSPLAPYRWPLLIGGLLALGGFVLVERHRPVPLVPLALWRSPAFSAASVVNFLLGCALIVAMVNVPVFVNTLASDLATAQWQSAVLLTPLTGGMALGSFMGGWASGRVGPRQVAAMGLTAAALAFGSMGSWPARLDLAVMAPPLLVLGLGFGMVIAPAAAVAVDSADERDHGATAALVLVLRLLGMAVGLSALTAWALSRLQLRLAALPPLTAGPAESAAEFASRMAREMASRAITQALQVLDETFWIAGAVCLVALPAVWWLHHAAPAHAGPRA